jgi:hypothetical protein
MDRWGEIDENEYEDDEFWPSEEDYIDDPQETHAEMKAFDRTGGAVAGVMTGMAFGGVHELQKLSKTTADPKEKFAIYVNAISRSLDSNNNVNVKEDDIIAMIENIRRLKRVEFINPTGYIVGYLATNGGKNMDYDNIQHVIEDVLPYTQTGFLQPPDVIRYARLWMSF